MPSEAAITLVTALVTVLGIQVILWCFYIRNVRVAQSHLRKRDNGGLGDQFKKIVNCPEMLLFGEVSASARVAGTCRIAQGSWPTRGF